MNSKPARASLDLTPAGRALIILASLALGAAWTTGNEPARLAAGLLLAPLIIDWACKLRWFDGVTIQVGARRTRAGATVLERATLHNRGRRALWQVQVTAHGLLNSVRGQAQRVECVARGGACEFDLLLRGRARGQASTRTFALITQHPLGLVQLSATISSAANVVVEPARIALPLLPDSVGRDGEAAESNAHGRDAEAFYALRELRDGEDFARVHALRSAAFGLPVRVLRRGAARHSVRVLLDLRSAPGRLARNAQGQAFEWALSAAATLVEDLNQRGRACDVVVIGKNSTSFAGLGERAAASRFFEFLAGARPQAYSPAPEATLAWLADGDGDVFWIAAGGLLAAVERERAGRRVQVLEWVA